MTRYPGPGFAMRPRSPKEEARRKAASAAKAETRQYAKRQLTWGHGNMIAWNWISEKETETIEARVVAFIDR